MLFLCLSLCHSLFMLWYEFGIEILLSQPSLIGYDVILLFYLFVYRVLAGLYLIRSRVFKELFCRDEIYRL